MEVLSSVISSSSANDYLKILGNQLNIDKDLLSCLKQHLLKPNSRKIGLAYLNTFLSQCSSEVLNEYGIFWIEICLKECKSDHALTQINSFNVLSKILHSCTEYPDLYKRISTDYLAKIIDNIYTIKFGSCQSLSALNCLRICLKMFPGFCGHHRSNIEKYIYSYIDSVNQNEIYLVSQCFHYLPQISGSGAQGSVHKLQWVSQQNRLCITLEVIFNTLFEYVDEINNMDVTNGEQLQFPEISYDDNRVIQIHKLANRFNNCVNLLQCMLIEPFPTPKKIALDKIINIISHTFCINSDLIKKNSLDDVALGTVITPIHNNMLQLLDALFSCLGTNILPYAGVISKMLIDILENTNLVSTQEKSFLLLKIQAYKTLSKWLTLAQGASCMDLFSDVLIPTIINDLTPNKINCILITQNNKSLTLKTKKKIQRKETNYIANKIENGNHKSNDSFSQTTDLYTELSIVALKTIEHLLESQSVLLQPLIHKVLQEFLVKQILELKKNSDISFHRSKLYYKQLYQTLIALVVNFHPTMSPPTFCVLDILSSGQKDREMEISQICTNGLLILEKIIHPPIPSFYPCNQQENSNYLIDFQQTSKKRKYSEENFSENLSNVSKVANTSLNVSNHCDVENVIEISSSDSDADPIEDPAESKNVDKDQMAMLEVIQQFEGWNQDLCEKKSNCKSFKNQNVDCDIQQGNALPTEVNSEGGIWEAETEILIHSCQGRLSIEKDVANLHDLHENSQDQSEYVKVVKKSKLSNSIEKINTASENSEVINEVNKYTGAAEVNGDSLERNDNLKEATEDGNELDAMLKSFVDVVQ